MKTAETLYDPFGEDDEDFDINELLDRHLRSYKNECEFLIVLWFCDRAGTEYVTDYSDYLDVHDVEVKINPIESLTNNNNQESLISNIQDIKGLCSTKTPLIFYVIC